MKENREHDISSEDFLLRVGSIIRGMRATRGITRRVLAENSSVSERYLANLEQGKGNVSINLLRKIARALNTGLTELLPTPTKQTPEQVLINEFVRRLSKEEQKETLRTLYLKFSSLNDKQKNVALIGLRGAGKTTLGSLLGKNKNIPFVRLAQKIEAIGNMKISEILSLSGQRGYRRLEEKALLSTLAKHEYCCIETGGSIVSEPKELNLLLTTCFVIWVRTTPEEHMARVLAQGDFRPMADNDAAMDDLKLILEERSPYYEKAHAILDTSGKTVQESYNELLKLIQDSQ